MANETEATALAVLTQELWRPQILSYQYNAMKIGKRVLNVTGDVAAKGDILHIPIEPSITVGAVTAATGAISNQAWTPTEAQLTVDKWDHATVDVVDMAQRQAIGDVLAQIRPGMGKAAAADIDEKLAALFVAGLTTNEVGSKAAPYDSVNPDILTSAIQKLLDLTIALEDPNLVSFFFHTSVWSQAKKIAEFNNANLTGKAVGGAIEMKIPDIYGVPVYFSTTIDSSSGVYKNALCHKECIGWGMQKNFNIETLARVRKSTPYSADWLFGVKVVRETYGCLINTIA